MAVFVEVKVGVGGEMWRERGGHEIEMGLRGILRI
jgi:hypothetical protein